jgi:hypothetical protein
VFCQAAIQFGLLLESKGEFGLAFRLCEASPQGHGDLNALAGGEPKKLGKGGLDALGVTYQACPHLDTLAHDRTLG